MKSATTKTAARQVPAKKTSKQAPPQTQEDVAMLARCAEVMDETVSLLAEIAASTKELTRLTMLRRGLLAYGRAMGKL